MFRSLVEKSLVLALLIVIHDAYCLGKTRIVYPRLLEARTPNDPLTLYINDEITLNLERANIFPETFLLQYPKGKTVINKYINGTDLGNMVYQDKDQMSAVAIERDEGFQVNGIIRNIYRIKPMHPMQRSDIGYLAHELVHVEGPHQNTNGDYLALPIQQTVELLKQRSTQRSDTVHPELIVIADIQTNKKMKNAIKAVLYISIMIVAVNLRFATMQNLKLEVRLCAVEVLKPKEKRDLYRHRFLDYKKYLDVKATIHELATKSDQEGYNYDLVLLLTRENLILIEGNVADISLKGFAFTGTACTQYKVGIVQDVGLGLTGINNIAHEIAHLLGCPHDGEKAPANLPNSPGATSCPASDGFLMSAVLSDTINKNVYRVSKCCEDMITYVVGKPEFVCLITDEFKILHETQYLPGKYLTTNEVCEKEIKLRGASRGFHEDEDDKLKNCILKCRTPDDENGSYKHIDIEAPDGTVCSKNLVCKAGNCTV